MAQGNYVTLPSGRGPDPFAGVGKSLADLSKMYANKATVERDEALQRDKMAVEQRRWDKAEQRRVGEDKFKEQERQRAQTARDVSWVKPTYTLEDYSPAVQREISKHKGALANERQATVDFITGAGGDIDKALTAYQANLPPSLDEASFNNFSAKRRAELEGLKKELGSYRGMDQIESRISELTKKFYDPQLASIDQAIAAGQGMTKEDQTRALMRKLTPAQRNALSRTEALAAVDKLATAPTKKALLTAEAERVKGLNAAEIAQMEALDKYNQRITGTGKRGKKSYSNNAKGVQAALEDMGNIDIGPFDTADARKGFEELLDRGMSPEVSASLVSYGVDKGWLGDSFPDIDSDEFTNLVLLGEKFKKKSKAGGGAGKVNREDYLLGKTKSKGLEQLLLDRAKMLGAPADTSFNVPSAFMEKYLAPKQNELGGISVTSGRKGAATPAGTAVEGGGVKGTGGDVLADTLLPADTSVLAPSGSSRMPRRLGGKVVSEEEYRKAVDEVGQQIIGAPLNFVNTGLNQLANYFFLSPARAAGRSLGRSSDALTGAFQDFQEWSRSRYKRPGMETNAAALVEFAKEDPEAAKTIADKVAKNPTTDSGNRQLPSVNLSNVRFGGNTPQVLAQQLRAKYPPADIERALKEVAYTNPGLATSIRQALK